MTDALSATTTASPFNGSSSKPNADEHEGQAWFEFSVLMGWPILTMAERRKPKFRTKGGETISIPSGVRDEIIAAINKPRS